MGLQKEWGWIKMVETLSDAANDFGVVAKSSVKLIKNSRGLNWEIKVVVGEEKLIEGLKNEALRVHKDIEKEFKGEMICESCGCVFKTSTDYVLCLSCLKKFKGMEE